MLGEEKREDKLRAYYEEMHVPACVKSFEEKMEYAWTAADLNISRSGSGTLAELIEYCVPSVLIPYPFGTENHQMKNATFVSDQLKGAITLEEKGLQGDILAAHLLELLEHSQEKLQEMRKNLQVYKEEENKQDLCSIVLKSI